MKLRERILRAVRQTDASDNLGRAQARFRHCTPEQMQQVYDPNTGETKQQVLDGYAKSMAEDARVVEWIMANVPEELP